MATTQSPTLSFVEAPTLAAGKSVASILITARSVNWSVCMFFRSASKVLPSLNSTVTVLAPSTTWLLVTMMPSLSIIQPEPAPSCVNGVPKISIVTTSVFIATTDGYTCSTTSAMLGSVGASVCSCGGVQPVSSGCLGVGVADGWFCGREGAVILGTGTKQPVTPTARPNTNKTIKSLFIVTFLISKVWEL